MKKTLITALVGATLTTGAIARTPLYSTGYNNYAYMAGYHQGERDHREKVFQTVAVSAVIVIGFTMIAVAINRSEPRELTRFSYRF